jgi:plasmid maintenance system antidote protein VapI
MENPIDFLNSEYRKRKDRNPNFSLRSFAKWLDVSPAQLSQMMAGKRNITFRTLKKINDRLGLSPVNSQELIKILLRQKNLISKPAEKKVSQLREDHFLLISDWYHLAILSLTKIKGAKSDPRWVARRLGIKIDEAHQALQRLERLGILQIKPVFKQIGDPFEVVSEIPSAAIRKYHKQNLALSMEKIETIEVALRQFQSISVPMNPSILKILKKEIDEFLSRISDICENSQALEVYNLNVQLFPVTQPATNVAKEKPC